jgi:uncharacterized protein YjbI with pentapeptide repeats
MANPEHVAKLKEGVEVWNQWRKDNPEIRPFLYGVDFTEDEFRITSLYKVDDKGNYLLDLTDINLEGTWLVKCRLPNSSFKGANLQGACFGESDLQGSDLRDSEIHGANFQQAILRGADLQSLYFLNARFQGANLANAKVQKAFLQSADFSDAWMENANLQEADFQGAALAGACLRRANLQCASLWQANAEGAALAHADLRGADLRGANFENANVTGVKFSRNSRQRKFQGIRVSSCYGSQMFKTFAQDQDYIEELRAGPWGRSIFWTWYVLADCGRSFLRWGGWAALFIFGFSLIYYRMGASSIKTESILDKSDFFTYVYYSIVTFTTLGFGDIVPDSRWGAFCVSLEVLIGYVMLGGLVSLLANKLARRS